MGPLLTITGGLVVAGLFIYGAYNFAKNVRIGPEPKSDEPVRKDPEVDFTKTDL